MTGQFDHEVIERWAIKSASLQPSFPFPSLFSTSKTPHTHLPNEPPYRKDNMDPHGDPKDEGVDPTKNILRTGKTPSGMPWTTYSTPFGEQTHTQEEEEKTGKDIERFFAPRTSTIYSHPKLGNVTFTNEEQDAIYREAASTLPKVNPLFHIQWCH